MKKPVWYLALVLPLTLFLAGCKDSFDLGTGIDLNLNERVDIAAQFQNGNARQMVCLSEATNQGGAA